MSASPVLDARPDGQAGGDPRPSAPRPASGSRLAGLDGLRAVAIAAVLIFHLNPAWLPGGFLGVDIFFVVSGFLITTLLVRERARTGRVDLSAFWTRRARRLLPALIACVGASVLLARLVETDLLVGIGRQILGALTFSTNWVEIAAGSDYFHSTTPQLFMNLWSLAVEEQFYLIWPLLSLALLGYVHSPRARAAIAAGAGVASTALMALRFDPDAGATRVYYGTDTHLMGLMFGAALAFAYAGPDRLLLDGAAFQRVRRPLTVALAGQLALLLWFADEASAWTFRGGLALACLVTTGLVALAVTGQGSLPRALDLPPLRWIGERSYGIYLWHWPVILVVSQDIRTTPGADGYLGSRLWCVLVTLAIADLSYRFVETPIRRDGFRAVARRVRDAAPLGRVRPATVVVAGLAIWAVAVAAVAATAPAQTSTQRMIDANATAAAAGGASRPRSTGAGGSGSVTQNWTMPTGKEIDLYGDSMAVGSVPALKYYFPGIRIDAKSNRRWGDALAAVTASGSNIRRAVVLSFGTNAGVDAAQLGAILDRLGPQRMVVLVNLHLNMARTSGDNAALAAAAASRPNVILADWNAAVTADPGQLQPDGIHPSLTGQHLYASTIRQAFADLSQRHTGIAVVLKPKPIP
ncbi:MAG: acyltransferase family protein [Tetrasphaera sp.]